MKINLAKTIEKLAYRMRSPILTSKMTRHFVLILLSSAIVLLAAFENEPLVEVSISQGKLRGSALESRNGSKFYAFQGIPYAKPPIGELRLESPQPPDSWDGIRDATNLPPVCIQKSIFFPHLGITGQEDCLYLNVYTPMVNNGNNELLPVMVFIHGGGFLEGSANIYAPDFIMDNRVVYVAMNYRLAALGFLSSADELLPGNYGLKDQTAALKWIRENIVQFSGDPTRVTIFGESAGGASVHHHMHSPLSKGLFHGAILQSGTALSRWALVPPMIARERAEAFALLIGCRAADGRILVDCLKKIPAEDFIHTHNKFYIWDIQPLIPFPPTVEPKNLQDAFLIEYPWHQNVVNDVPVVIGYTSGEGAILAARYFSQNTTYAKTIDENYERLFPHMFSFGAWTNPKKHSEISKAIRTFYFKDRPISEETALEFVDLISDGFFINSIEAAMRHTNTVFMYCYDHLNEESFASLFGNCSMNLGVCHADDLLSLFPIQIPNAGLRMTSKADVAVSQRMISYWINFAYTGNPGWQSTTSDSLKYLRIMTDKDEMRENTLQDRYSFWKNLDLGPQLTAIDVTNSRDEL